MRTIISVEHIQRCKATDTEKEYWRTHAIVDDGTECVGYGKDFDIGDKVEVFHDVKWDTVKMRKPLT